MVKDPGSSEVGDGDRADPSQTGVVAGLAVVPYVR